MTTAIKLMLEDGSIIDAGRVGAWRPCADCRHVATDNESECDKCAVFNRPLNDWNEPPPVLNRLPECILAQGRYEGAQMKDEKIMGITTPAFGPLDLYECSFCQKPTTVHIEMWADRIDFIIRCPECGVALTVPVKTIEKSRDVEATDLLVGMGELFNGWENFNSAR